MALTLKSEANVTGNQNPDWYLQDNADLAGVTNMPSNPAIGLENVLIFPPNDKQRLAKVVCSGVLKTIVGDINITIFESKNTPGTMYIRTKQTTEQLDNGEVRHYNEVKLTRKVQAQVLRYMHTQVAVSEAPPVQQPTGAFANVGATSVAGQTHIPVVNQAPPVTHQPVQQIQQTYVQQPQAVQQTHVAPPVVTPQPTQAEQTIPVIPADAFPVVD